MDLSSFPKAAQLSSLGRHAPRWRPGLGGLGYRTVYAEIFAASNGAAGAGFALALALDEMGATRSERLEEKPLLWVQDQASIRRNGRPCRSGLPASLRDRVIHTVARTAEDALFALEEGLRCRDLAFVLGELAGDPRAMDFTASRRFSLAAEKHGVPLYLVRHDAARNLSAARLRWQVRPAVSALPVWNRDAPGRPAWRAELFRARAHPPGEWILRDDGRSLVAEPAQPAAPDHGDLAGAAGA